MPNFGTDWVYLDIEGFAKRSNRTVINLPFDIYVNNGINVNITAADYYGQVNVLANNQDSQSQLVQIVRGTTAACGIKYVLSSSPFCTPTFTQCSLNVCFSCVLSFILTLLSALKRALGCTTSWLHCRTEELASRSCLWGMLVGRTNRC